MLEANTQINQVPVLNKLQGSDCEHEHPGDRQIILEACGTGQKIWHVLLSGYLIVMLNRLKCLSTVVGFIV